MQSGRRTTYGRFPSVGRPRRRRNHTRVVMLFFALALASLIIHNRVFILQEILIIGNEQKTASEIAGLTRLSLGMNIFDIDKEAVMRNVSSDAYVEVLNVEIKLPHAVIISVKERTAAAAVNCAGVILLVDSNGYILERLDSIPQDDDVIIISGMDVSVNAQGSMIESGVIGQQKTMQTVLEVLKENGAENLISELNVANLDNLYLVSKTGIQVLIGDEELLKEKILWMQVVLKELTQSGVTSGILDVSSGKNAVFANG